MNLGYVVQFILCINSKKRINRIKRIVTYWYSIFVTSRIHIDDVIIKNHIIILLSLVEFITLPA